MASTHAISTQVRMMERASQWRFGPFQLDTASASLWRDGEMIALPPKPLAVLAYLVRHAGQPVLKEMLLDEVWPETTVGDAVLKTCMSQIRKALGETARSPQFVATVHRKGYRFIAPVTPVASQNAEALVALAGDGLPALQPLIERDAVFASLRDHLMQAAQGRRQVVFLSGEAGIGKTSVIDAFAVQVAAAGQALWAAGQCVEHYGAGEAYLPVLEALGRLCRGAEGGRVVSLLRRLAPTWLAQMPWLLSASDRELLQHELLGVTRERMLRELAEALETLSMALPVVLVIEDLHWSDYATLDAIAMLARRQEPARLLLLGAYRPVDTIVAEHPLRAVIQDLRLRGQGVDYPLSLLSERAVEAYVSARFPQHRFSAALSRVLHRRTDGNPLFLTTMIEALLRQEMIGREDGGWALRTTIEAVAAQVPEGLQAMIEQQLERLSAQDQRTLEAGSAVGVEFSTAALAATLGEDRLDVEARCERLARQQLFLRSLGLEDWPDGTAAGRYGFIHSLYQRVAYQRIGAGRRVQLHRRISACLETAYEGSARDMATELARHAQHGRDASRAVRFLLQAAQEAMRRYAPRDAYDHLRQGLDLLQALPPAPERTQQELTYLMVLRVALGAMQGYRAPEMTQALRRIEELYPQVERLPAFAMGYWKGLWVWHLQRGASLRTAQDVAERYLDMAQRQRQAAHILQASQALGTSLLVLGQPALALAHLERASAMYDPARHSPAVIGSTEDAGVSSLCWMAWALWLLGRPDQALQRNQEALALARQLAHPYSRGFALGHVTRRLLYRGEYREAQRRAQELLALGAEYAFPVLQRQGVMLHGWALASQGEMTAGIEQMRQVVATGRGAEASTFAPRDQAVLAEQYRRLGQAAEGLELVDDALGVVAQCDGHYHEAELHRLKGELLLLQAPGDTPAAAARFRRALELAQRQEMKTWELRAAVSLGRLWRGQGRPQAARDLLAPIYTAFTEGFDTLDLQEARSLLDALGA